MARSANSFYAGAIVRCLIPFMSVKFWNSLLVKAEPLLITTASGIPCMANMRHNFWMIPVEVGVAT